MFKCEDSTAKEREPKEDKSSVYLQIIYGISGIIVGAVFALILHSTLKRLSELSTTLNILKQMLTVANCELQNVRNIIKEKLLIDKSTP